MFSEISPDGKSNCNKDFLNSLDDIKNNSASNIDDLVDDLLARKGVTKRSTKFNNWRVNKDPFLKRYKVPAKKILALALFFILIIAVIPYFLPQVYGNSDYDVTVVIEPNDVYDGDSITVSVFIPSYYNITSVTADIVGIETIGLGLVDRSDRDLWQANWIVHDLDPGEHVISINALDDENETYSAGTGLSVLMEEPQVDPRPPEPDVNETVPPSDTSENETIPPPDSNESTNETVPPPVDSNETTNDTIPPVDDNETVPPDDELPEPPPDDGAPDSPPDIEPDISGTPFNTFEAPRNSLGPSSFKIINMDYFWKYFEKHSGWILEAFDPVSRTWVDYSRYLNIVRDRSEDNQSEKISLEFNAPITADYRLTYQIKKPLKSYVDRSDENIYELVYSIGNNDEYSTYFDFSDIATLPDVTLDYGVRNINGEDRFVFSVQRNNIAAGTYVFLDPTFGNTATGGSAHNGNEIPGGYFQMGAIGGTADSITGYFVTAGGANAGYAAIYDSGRNLITNGVSDVNTGVQDGWETFSYSTAPTLAANAWYYLVVFINSDKSDLQYATSGGSGLYRHTGQTYPNFPDPYAASVVDADALVHIYCTYTAFDIDPPTPDPMTWSTQPYNVSSSNITMVATTASDSTPPIEYYFNETTDNPGGSDSGWQTSTTYSDEGLSENTQYGYEVKARDSNGTVNENNYSAIYYEYTSVETPTDAELTFTNGTSWVNATVVQPPNPTTDWTASNFSWITGGAAYSDWQNGTYYHNRTGLDENTEYGCQVQLRNGDGNATEFNPTEKTNYTQCNPPADAEFLLDGEGITWINMSVLDVDFNPTAGFTAAYFECVTGGASDSGWITDTESGRYYYNATGLSADTTYGFRVKYRNAESVETTYTSEKQTTTDAPVPPTVTTNATTGVETINATLHGWLQEDSGVETMCWFLLNDTNDFEVPLVNISEGVITVGNEFENDTIGETTLTAGKLYYFMARANNSAGWSNGSVEILLTKPENITSFTATLNGATQIDLTWTDGTGGDGAYIEYNKNTPLSPWNEGDGTPVDADGNVTSLFAHAGLDPGTTYYYKAWGYATDGSWTSSGNQSAPRGNATTASQTTTGKPTVTTNDTTNINTTNATLEGWLQSNGTLDTYCYLLLNDTEDFDEPMINISKGIIENGQGFSNDTTDEATLTAGTLYYVDTKANNTGGWHESGGVLGFLTRPGSPSDLVAQMNSSSVIYLTWSAGTAANTTYIERNASGQTVWGRGEGTVIYNGSGTNFEDTGLVEGVTYYYRAWNFANWTNATRTFHQYSEDNDSDYNTTNNIPTISNEDPTNESTGVSVPKQLAITVNDVEGADMTITWYSNSSGSWLIFGQNTSVGNGTYYFDNGNFSNYSSTYYWNVSVSDGNETNDSDIFWFSTETLITSVDPIAPYMVTSSPKNITATGDPALDQIALYYRWSDDNQTFDDWDVLTYDDFEGGFGNYTDGGANCVLYTGGTYAYQGHGTNAIDIQDGTGDPSSFYTSSGIDVDSPDYQFIKVDFWFYAVGMEAGEVFYLEYFDGTDWQIIETYDSGTDFLNTVHYHEVVWINESSYTYPSNMQIKFRCAADQTNDDVYIDEVYVNATAQSTLGNGINWTLWNDASNPDTDDPWSWDFNFPMGAGYYEFYSEGNKTGSNNETAPATADTTCRFNSMPTMSDEFPTNGSTNIQLTPLTMNITINDFEGENMNITWSSNSSGAWVVFGENNSVGNGTYSQLNSNFTAPGQTYWWNVTVVDSLNTNNSMYYFTTSYAPVASSPGPTNESTTQFTTPVCNFTLYDQDGDTVTVQWYENTTGLWVLQQTNSSVDATTPVNVSWDNYTNATEDYTKYWWKVNLSDGKGGFVEYIYHFTTANTSFNITPDYWYQGALAIGSTNETTGFYFNLSTDGDTIVDIQIKATNATNSSTGVIWELSDTPAYNNYSLQYNLSDSGTWTNINLSYDWFVRGLTIGSWQTFDLKLLTATSSVNGDPLECDVVFRSVKS